MKNILVSLFAETFIHPGSGQSDGAIDLPVARERVTGYPFIAGSSLKGAWRDYAEQTGWNEDKRNAIFGEQEKAGQLLFSDARLLLLPVRSLNCSYCWVTSPLVLERLARDLERGLGKKYSELLDVSVAQGRYLGLTDKTALLFLEERSFTHSDECSLDDIVIILKELIPPSSAADRLKDQLVIINDTDFKWFCENALSVQARNVLDDDTKQSKNLWYEETLPPDTLMTSLVGQRNVNESALQSVVEQITERPYIQVGGNETIGQGWFNLGICAQKTELTDE